jgi:hypothetical protein
MTDLQKKSRNTQITRTNSEKPTLNRPLQSNPEPHLGSKQLSAETWSSVGQLWISTGGIGLHDLVVERLPQ